ncbi:MAG: DUF2330 domain-containing protein [Myxococcota bacterium]
MLLALVPAALPCGGFVAPPAGSARSDTQEAIFTPGADSVRVDYRVLYDGDTETFGWIIPVPGAFVSLADGDSDDFSEIRDATMPLEDMEERERGCAPATKGGDLSDSGGVDVVATGFTGTYAYTALDATSSDALLAWLSDNGFDVGPNGPAIDAYVAEGGWQFVAISLTKEVEATVADTGGELQYEVPPVSIVYEGTRVVYPARMGAGSTTSTMHTIVYVKGDQRAHVSGWGEEEIVEVRDAGEDPGYVSGELWYSALAGVGSEMKFGVIFAGVAGAGEGDGEWVTRFETLAPPDVMDADATFTLDGGTAEMRTLVTNKGEGCGGSEAALFLLAPGLLLRRRR